jgi:NAD(P)H-quinone oxidoreductase subunit J
MQQGWLSNWLVKHEVVHRSWDSIAVILYVYGYNYLRSQCAYDVAPGGSLASASYENTVWYR